MPDLKIIEGGRPNRRMTVDVLLDLELMKALLIRLGVLPPSIYYDHSQITRALQFLLDVSVSTGNLPPRSLEKWEEIKEIAKSKGLNVEFKL